MKTLYERLVAAGVTVDHHESDLYFPLTVGTQAIIASWEAEAGIKLVYDTFMPAGSIFDEIWVDAFGMYDPYWLEPLGL